MKRENNKLKIEDLLGGLEGIFYPDVVYDGTHYLSLINIFNAGLRKNNVNLAEEYFYNKYKDIFINNFKDFEWLKSYLGNMLLVSTPSAVSQRDKLVLDPSFIFIGIASSDLYCDIPFSLSLEKEELRERFNTSLKDLRKRLRSLIAGEIKLEEDEQITKIYNSSNDHFKTSNKRNIGIRRYETLSASEKYSNRCVMVVDATPDFTNNEDLMNYMSGTANNITVLLRAFDTFFDDLYRRPLDLKELGKYINFDTLYLLIAKQYMDYCKIAIKKNDRMDYSAVYLSRYEKAVRQMMKNQKYFIEIDFKNIKYKDDKTYYSTIEFLNEFKQLKEEYPDEELDYYDMIDPYDGNDYTVLDNVKNEIERLKTKKETEVLLANWDFIPKGEIKKEAAPKIRETVANEKKIVTNDKVDEENTFEAVLETLDYEYQLSGKDKFIGYRGYMFSNGYVLFEKIKTDDNKVYRIPGNATYLMNIGNFRKMSKLSKPEIMAYIKAGNKDVRKINHTSNYLKKVLEVQNKAPYYDVAIYNDGIIGVIRNLIDAGELIKELPKEEARLKLTDHQ